MADNLYDALNENEEFNKLEIQVRNTEKKLEIYRKKLYDKRFAIEKQYYKDNPIENY